MGFAASLHSLTQVFCGNAGNADGEVQAREVTASTGSSRHRLSLRPLHALTGQFYRSQSSQMAVVQHTMMAQLDTGRVGGTGVGGGGGGGRASKVSHKPWRSQFNQFKIEPLLIRNAPSVE
ncbi:hypothetical protein Hamer_G022989, partial [Homarus americanus]